MAQANNTTSLLQITTKIPIHIRPTSTKDHPALSHIFNHYIINCVISFRLEPVDAKFFKEILDTTTEHDLPFLVATTTFARPLRDEREEDTVTLATQEKIIGYAYAMPWRPNYPAYRHTVEISIYLHPEYVSNRVGSRLMDLLMDALRKAHVRYIPNVNTSRNDDDDDDPEEPNGGEGRIHQVLSIMSLDTEGRDGGHALEKFYTRWGFERIGHMKRVGFKFGRWIDVLMLQASLFEHPCCSS